MDCFEQKRGGMLQSVASPSGLCVTIRGSGGIPFALAAPAGVSVRLMCSEPLLDAAPRCGRDATDVIFGRSGCSDEVRGAGVPWPSGRCAPPRSGSKAPPFSAGGWRLRREGLWLCFL
jgi:hypothetical protein